MVLVNIPNEGVNSLNAGIDTLMTLPALLGKGNNFFQIPLFFFEIFTSFFFATQFCPIKKQHCPIHLEKNRKKQAYMEKNAYLRAELLYKQ